MHQRYLGHLGLGASDVGLDRDRLLGGPGVGLAVVFLLIVLYPLAVVAVIGLVMGGPYLLAARARSRGVGIALAVGACLLLAALAALLSAAFLPDRAVAMPTGSRTGAIIALTASAAVLSGLGASSGVSERRRRRGEDEPREDVPPVSDSDAWIIAGTVVVGLASAGVFAIALGYTLADVTADRVKRGVPGGGRGLLNIPLIAADARRIRLDRARATTLDPDARRHAECLLYVGRGDAGEVLWDVRRQRALRVRLPADAFETTSSDQPVPAHCAPEPEPGDDDAFLVKGRRVAAVRAVGTTIGWQQRVHGRWLTLASSGGITWRVGPSLRWRARWDLGPAVVPGVSAVVARCRPRGCAIRWWPLLPGRSRTLHAPAARGCALDGVTVARAEVALAWSGARCSRRGLWRWTAGGWRRFAGLRPRARVTSLDAWGATAAWTADDEGTWRVTAALLRGRRRWRLATDRDVMRGHEVRLSSVAVGAGHVRWSVTHAAWAGARGTFVMSAIPGRSSCDALARDLPGRADGSGLDAAVAGKRVVFARRGALMARRLSEAQHGVSCDAPFD